jgi:hypothetical protein
MLDSVLLIIIIFAIFYYILLIKQENNQQLLLKEINNKIDNISYFSYPYDFVEYYFPYFDPFNYFGRLPGPNITLRYPHKNRYYKRGNKRNNNRSKGLRR